jgi:hypothetical protein
MLCALPSRSSLSPIHFSKRPYVSDDFTPNKMVERQSFRGKVRQLRTSEELLSQPLHEVRSEATQAHESQKNQTRLFLLPQQRPITGIASIDIFTNSSKFNQLQNPKLSNFEDQPSSRPEYIAPVLADQLSPFLERELIGLFDDAQQGQAERVLEYLARAESREIDPWAQDDIRVAWMAVLYAARGFQQPWEYAFWCYYGKTAAKAIPIWLERDAARDAMLGPGLSEGEEIYPPKKPVQSVREIPDQKKEIL